jgi:GMP synthase (glutamine-hydrolysing)
LEKIGKSDIQEWLYSDIENREPPKTEAMILSGSEASLTDSEDFDLYKSEIELIKKMDLPILGICFGHQLIGKTFGSQLGRFDDFVKGFRTIEIIEPNDIFSSWKIGQNVTVFQYHKDYLTNPPKDFVLLAKSESCEIEAMKHQTRPIYSIQAHIEKATDQHIAGKQILKNFMENTVQKAKAEGTERAC